MTLEAFREQRGAMKRAAVTEAARALFMARGYDGTSMETVATEAGVSTATIYSHFGSKAQVFAAVVAEAVEMMEIPAEGDLDITARAYARLMADPSVRALMRLVIAESPRFPELGQALYETGKARVYDAFRRAFAAEQARGRLARLGDPDRAANQITGMIAQSVLMPPLLTGEPGPRDPDEVAASAVARFRSGAD